MVPDPVIALVGLYRVAGSLLALRTFPRGHRTALVLAGLLAAKLVQEWALHVARLFDSTTFLDAVGAIWEALTAPIRGR